MSNKDRIYNCGQLTPRYVGQIVTLCGWVYRRRDHGGLIFIDLRDRYGITQVVFNPKHNQALHLQANSLRSEFALYIKGKVKMRPKGTENERISTGRIEVIANELTVLNTSKGLPFEIDNESQISEEMRLAYRYLDLRRPGMLEKLIFRHRICKLIRDFLDKEGFLEVETPLLTKSTPEGARDYLVPSRLNVGRFYALPQSPQLFKQILMVSGLDKYFQIARCFRDEDLRADRQPEFTQLDIEMSFVDEEDILSLVERLMVELFCKAKDIKLKTPFPRLGYQQAIEKYGTDRPDLRKKGNGFAFVWIVNFPLFKYNVEEKRWETEHHPFTSPREKDVTGLTGDLASVRARAYDLVVNGIEIGSGSIRIHKREIQERIFTILGLSQEERQQRFGFLLEALSYGAPPHGGIAFGLDRLIALLSGLESIREVIAFPKTQQGICPLTGAPQVVLEKQLKELGLILNRASQNSSRP